MRSVARVARVAARARDARGAPRRAIATAVASARGGARDVPEAAASRATRCGNRARGSDAVARDDRATATRGRDVETFAHEGATTANLGAWLARRGVAVDKFDRARGTKNLEDLLIELKSGESVLVSERERASGEERGETG